MTDFVPLFRTPTRAEALDILQTSRAVTESMIRPLSPAQLRTPTVLGDGTWSIKDLIGHLATWEERALVVAGVRPPTKGVPAFQGTDEFNAHHLERKRPWSLAKVQKESTDVRAALLGALRKMDDEQWYGKIDAGGRRSALGLVLAKVLTGGRYGYFAHDLAHRSDLEKAVRELG